MKSRKKTRVIILHSDNPDGYWTDCSIEYWHGSKLNTRFKRQYWPCIISREHLILGLKNDSRLLAKATSDLGRKVLTKRLEHQCKMLALVDENGYAYEPFDEEKQELGYERASDLYIKDKYISIKAVEKAIKTLVNKVHKKKNVKVEWLKYPKQRRNIVFTGVFDTYHFK